MAQKQADRQDVLKPDILVEPISIKEEGEPVDGPAIFFYKKGRILFRQGKYGEALKAFEKATEKEPGCWWAWHYFGLSYFFLEKLPESLKALEEAGRRFTVSFHPPDPVMSRGGAAIWYNMGVVLAKLGKFEDAEMKFEIASGFDSGDAQVQRDYGTLCLILWKLEDAIRAFDKAIKLGPKDPIAWNNKGIAVRLKESRHHGFWEALKCFYKATEIDPGFVNAYYNEAKLLLDYWHDDVYDNRSSRTISDQRKDLAEKILGRLEKTISVDGKDACLWVCKGELLLNLKKYGEALAAIEKAIELDGKNWKAWLDKGKLLLEAGNLKESAGLFGDAADKFEEATASFKKANKLTDRFARKVQASMGIDDLLERAKKARERAKALKLDKQ